MRSTTNVIALLVILLSFSICQAQEKQLPPLGYDAIQNVGKVIHKYDRFTNMTKTEVVIRLRGTYLDGLNLTLFSFYEGQIAPNNPDVYVGLLSVSDEIKYETSNNITFLVDGQRQHYKPLHFPKASKDRFVVEFLLIEKTFTKADIEKLSNAKEFAGRLGISSEFTLSKSDKEIIREDAYLPSTFSLA